jgi:hypothetical protein
MECLIHVFISQNNRLICRLPLSLLERYSMENSATFLLHAPQANPDDENCPSLLRVLRVCHALAESIYPIANSQVDLGLADPACCVS